MKKKQTNKKPDSILHIQEIAHSRKKSTKILLQILVWILIVAFVTTLGVTWGDAANNSLGNIVSTSKLKVDLAPSSLFFRERENLFAQITENNTNADPRIINSIVNTNALERTEASALRYNFIQDIRLKPSVESAELIRQNPASTAPYAVDYYYGIQSLVGQLGVYFAIAEPSISDLYAFNDVSRLGIAAEALEFSTTNFYGAQIPLEEKEVYYSSHLTNWADRVVAASFVTESRSNALEISKILVAYTNFAEGFAAAKALIDSKEDRWTNSSYADQDIIFPQPTTYDLFMAGADAYGKKSPEAEAAVATPVYFQGKYTILYVTSAGSYAALTPIVQQFMSSEMVSSRYKELEKTYKTAYLSNLETFKAEAAAGTPLAQIPAKVDGARYDISQPFSPLANSVSSVSGAVFVAPILDDPQLLKALLFSNANDVISSKKYKDTSYIVRALNIEKPRPEDLEIDIAQAAANPQNMQNIFGYRSTMIDGSLSKGLAKRYNLKSNSALLTNFN
ncbi:MAG: hypothetical protein ACRCY4_07905 [Brevinema sp.]